MGNGVYVAAPPAWEKACRDTYDEYRFWDAAVIGDADAESQASFDSQEEGERQEPSEKKRRRVWRRPQRPCSARSEHTFDPKVYSRTHAFSCVFDAFRYACEAIVPGSADFFHVGPLLEHARAMRDADRESTSIARAQARFWWTTKKNTFFHERVCMDQAWYAGLLCVQVRQDSKPVRWTSVDPGCAIVCVLKAQRKGIPKHAVALLPVDGTLVLFDGESCGKSMPSGGYVVDDNVRNWLHKMAHRVYRLRAHDPALKREHDDE